VAIDLGLDLVLFEVTASRFTEKSLVDADAEKVRADIAKMVTEKLRQLDRVITDLKSEEAQLPEVEMRLVQRIWPVVVTGDFVWQNPALHAHIRSGMGGLFARPGIQPFTLLNMEDYERVLGLPSQGFSIVTFLERKTNPQWRKRDFVSWFNGDPLRFGSGRSDFLEGLYFRAFDAYLAVLGFTLHDDVVAGRKPDGHLPRPESPTDSSD
jgi:hypothetical protein